MKLSTELLSGVRCAAILLRHMVTLPLAGIKKTHRSLFTSLETERQLSGGAPQWELAIETVGNGLRPMPIGRDLFVLRGDIHPKWVPVAGTVSEGGMVVYRVRIGELVRSVDGSTGRVVAVQGAIRWERERAAA